MNTLEQLGIRFEYTYTDISTSFFGAAEKRFEKYLKHIKFMKLNIEEDPLAQGLIPEYFDFVYCGEVVHATRDIKESLRNIRKVMKPYARLNLIETTRVSRLLTFLVGMLEGYWRFRDFELRPKYCVMEKNVWKQVLQSEGFQVDGIFSTTIDYHSSICAQKTTEIINSPVELSKMWLLFHLPNNPISVFFISKLAQVPGRSIVVIETGSNFQTNVDNSQFVVRESEYEDFVLLFSLLKARKEDIEGIVYCWALNNSVTSQELLLQPYFNLTKNVFNLKKIPRLSLITTGIVPLEDNDLAGFNASTLWGYSKTMKNENSHFNCRCIEVADGNVDDLRLQELFYEVWNSDMQNQVAFAKNSRLVPKYTPHKPLNNALNLPNGTNRFQLILPETKSIDDLQFGPLGLNDLKGDEVEVQIKASALNFRDVFCVLKPSDEFKDSNAVGCDFAGVVKQVGENVTKWKVGDRVCGCNVNFTAMPSHLTLLEDLLFQLPAHLSYCEGATMPAVYITSFLCLVEIANITKDDVVLIHAASGGVGLSAIEICRHIGCKIIATAGSKRKQNFLRNLGIEHIFHSRNTEYGDQILELTKGRGVDVVLNSLTSEGFKEASLKSCAPGARFVEMSKLNIWTKEEVKELRPDVGYTAVYLSESDTNEWIRYISSLKLLLRKGVAKPIPYLRFDAQNIREALKYMQKAKHIGKVVCVLPEIKMDRGLIKIHTPMFNDNSTYLITGGSGGIGFIVCKWMVEKGAKNVVLAARSPPKPSIQVVINEMNSTGANIISVQLDVGNREECRHLIQIKLEELGLPALKGIMHAAGTLSDGLIVNQDWEKLSSIFNPKISGTLNLHELTQHLNLEHFVLFSSSVALFGAPGQSNHAAANAFEDTFAHYRNSLGLPATTINWGQWGEVGVATEVDVPGLKTLSNRQGLIGLEYVMKTQRIQASIINVSSFVLLSKVYPSLSFYADECIAKTASGGTKFSLTLDEFWQQYDSLVELYERVILLKKTLGFIVYSVLRMDASDSINYNINFQDLGVDSLMFVEIKNLIQTLMGNRLVVSTSAIKESDTINFLGDTLVGLIEGDIEHDNTKPTHEQVNQLIREDCHLPDHIFAKDGQQAKLVGEVRTILLTGCTGTLGPYILRELTNRSQITEIFCLIRPSKTNSIKQRLISVLEGMGLLSHINMKKVTCISGNVAATKLGIDEKIYAELSGKVDAIFHCAACVIHTQHYKRINSLSDMRAVNVGGTTKVLEFACDNRLKHVFHVSSIVTATMVDGGSGKFSERWPDVQDYDNVTTLGYPVSKFVGDVLAKQAVERGIPVKAFRLPLILGESDTGRCSIKFNHMILRYLFIMKTGIMPSIPMPLIALPVDTCTEASVQLFFNEKLPVGIHNISHRNPDTDQEFVNIAKRFGYHVDVVDFSEFAKRVRDSESGEGDSALPIFKDFYADDEEFTVSFANTPFLRKWIDGNYSDDFWMSTLVEECLPSFYEKQKPSMEYLYDSLRFCKKQGWFREFGLRCD
ncbi:unnamed protein product [Orchesella dallaii]|uniref:Carrier domain-containing protein n=1 Tax=Orchesella dallaii TaxID=48710 RepID=A0ABP1RN17_9HEXA